MIPPRTRNHRRVTRQGVLERYASGSVLPRFEAVLIMDSQATGSSVRSQAFSTGWSRLYHAGEYYLDLSLKQVGDRSVVMGYVLPPVGEHQVEGRVRIVHLAGETGSVIGAAGDFRLEMNRCALHGLEVQLPTVLLSVGDLSILA